MIKIWTNLCQRESQKYRITNKYYKVGTITGEAEIQMIMREFCQQLYGNTFENRDKIDIVLEKITY